MPQNLQANFPQTFGAIGDGVADDTAAWNAFQASTGIKFVPAGLYRVNGEVKRFDIGCIGNGEFDDASAAWDQPEGDRERHAILVHRNDLDVNQTVVSPVIKTQTNTHWERETPVSGFKHVLGAYHEQTLDGYYNIQEDQNNNFTAFGAVSKNNMAGKFGSLAGLFYVSDAKESENSRIATMGATKNGCIYAQPTRRAKYSSGGYMFGYEVICLNTSDDVSTPIPYTNNDEFAFDSWTAGHKISARANGAPITTGIFLSGSGSADHGFWNGIVVGSSAFIIDGNPNGPKGTVGINFASWRDAAGWGDIGIKFRKANRHIHFREGAKIHSVHTRIMSAGGACGLSIEGATGEMQYLNFRDGSTADQDGGGVRNIAEVRATNNQFTLNSPNGELIFSSVDKPRLRVNSARLAPVNDQGMHLGAGSTRFDTIYASSGTINTSDEREKTDIAHITDEVLDAWGDVQFKTYKWLSAVANKGGAARTHYGLIAQQVRDAFAARGLDGTDYGLLCYDEWEGVPEQVSEARIEVKAAVHEQIIITPAQYRDEFNEDTGEYEQVEVVPAQCRDGDVIEPAIYDVSRSVVSAIPAGNRWGIRVDQCMVLEAAYQRRRADRIEQRLADIEDRLSR